MSYQVLMTIASFEIVQDLPKDAFALVFGLNTFAAVCVQSLLSLAVNSILGAESQTQFIIYAGFHFFIAIIYVFFAIYQLMKPQKYIIPFD